MTLDEIRKLCPDAALDAQEWDSGVFVIHHPDGQQDAARTLSQYLKDEFGHPSVLMSSAVAQGCELDLVYKWDLKFVACSTLERKET